MLCKYEYNNIVGGKFMPMWLCRAGRYGEYENKFLEEGFIYCTWENVPKSLTSFSTKQELQQYFIDNDTDIKVKTAMNWASQVWPFGNEMRIGEIIILPSKIKPVVYFAKIVGDYEYIPENGNPYYHRRKVKWIGQGISRQKFDQDILYSFGAFMTICRIKQDKRIMAVVDASMDSILKPRITEDGTEIDETSRDIEAEAIADISNLIISKAKGHNLAKIVNAILKAKGFTTYFSPSGPDKGIDILASSGVLGFGSPKICVQVKSGDDPVDRTVLDQLGGVMKNVNAEYGLLVSWSGFKSSIIKEMAAQFFNIRLWTHIEIIDELLKYYDSIDGEIREMIPLKRIWIANPSEE
jgi:restriction system protein